MSINDIEQPLIGSETTTQILFGNRKAQIFLAIIYKIVISVQCIFGYRYINNFQDCSVIISFPLWLASNGTADFFHLLIISIYLIINRDRYAILSKWMYRVFLFISIFSLAWWFIGAVVFFYYCYNYLNAELIIIGYIGLAFDFIKHGLIARYH